MRELIEYCERNKNILAVVQYGSSARGDSEENSDVDIFILLNNESSKDFIFISEFLEKKYKNVPLDASFYTSDRFKLMVKHGSLFLWHLKLEGKLIYSTEYFDKHILKLSEFKGSIEDLNLYTKILNSTKKSLNVNGINYYDLSILSTLARNTLILACYNINRKQFGKMQVYNTLKEYYEDKLPIKYHNYSKLNNYRSYYHRKAPMISLPSQLKLQEYILDIENVLNFTFEQFNVNNSLDRLTYIINSNIDKSLYTSFELNIDIERDFYIYLKELCNNYYQYDLHGLSYFHIECLNQYVKSNKFPENKIINMGISLFHTYNQLKKETSIYEPERQNLFLISKTINESNLINNSLFNFIINHKNTAIAKVLLKINFLNKFLQEIENQKKITNFTFDLKYFSEHSRKILESTKK